jgi:hypothetical protein
MPYLVSRSGSRPVTAYSIPEAIRAAQRFCHFSDVDAVTEALRDGQTVTRVYGFTEVEIQPTPTPPFFPWAL